MIKCNFKNEDDRNNCRLSGQIIIHVCDEENCIFQKILKGMDDNGKQ